MFADATEQGWGWGWQICQTIELGSKEEMTGWSDGADLTR